VGRVSSWIILSFHPEELKLSFTVTAQQLIVVSYQCKKHMRPISFQVGWFPKSYVKLKGSATTSLGGYVFSEIVYNL